MKKYKGIIAIIFLMLFYSCEKSKNTLKVGTTGNIQPYTYVSDNKLTGINCEITEEMAKRAKVKIQWVITPFDTLLKNLEEGKFDLGSSHITITPDREKIFNFTTPIYTNRIIIVENIKNTNKSKIKKYGAIKGSSNEKIARGLKKGEVVTFFSPEEGLVLLNKGDIDYVVMSEGIFRTEEWRFFNLKIKEILQEESIGIAISKKLSTKTTEKLNKALKEMEEDGTLREIQKKYGI